LGNIMYLRNNRMKAIDFREHFPAFEFLSVVACY